MKWTIRTIAAALALMAAAPAAAQSNPGLKTGQVPTTAQWNSYFSAKQDVLGFAPLNRAGGVMTGPLVTAPGTAQFAPFSITPGSAPTLPNNGDMWTTTSGLFVRINSATVGPLAGPSALSFAATPPLAVTFPSGITTYALNFDSNFATVGGNLAFSPIASGSLHANAGAGSAAPGATTPTAWLDRWCASVDGSFVTRTSGVWGCGTTGVSGHAVPYLDGANVWSSAISLSADITPTTLSGNVNDYAPAGFATAFTLRIDGGAADRDITGLAGGTAGRAVRIVNVGATNNLRLVTASGSSSAANQFQFAASLTLAPNSALTVVYDGTASRWRLWSHAPSLVVNGGTGLAGGTSGGVLAFTGATTLASSAALAAGGIVVGGGAGAVPASTGCVIDATNNLTCTSGTTLSPKLTVANTTNDGTTGFFQSQKDRNGAAVQNGDFIFAFQSNAFANAAYQAAFNITASVAAAPSGSNVPTKFQVATSNASGNLNQVLTFDNKAHVGVAASAASTSANPCGTSPGTPAGSDFSGTVTTGTGAPTSCQINFAANYSAAPKCTCGLSSGTGCGQSAGAVGSATFTFAAGATSNTLTWICVGT